MSLKYIELLRIGFLGRKVTFFIQWSSSEVESVKSGLCANAF